MAIATVTPQMTSPPTAGSLRTQLNHLLCPGVCLIVSGTYPPPAPTWRMVRINNINVFQICLKRIFKTLFMSVLWFFLRTTHPINRTLAWCWGPQGIKCQDTRIYTLVVHIYTVDCVYCAMATFCNYVCHSSCIITQDKEAQHRVWSSTRAPAMGFFLYGTF